MTREEKTRLWHAIEEWRRRVKPDLPVQMTNMALWYSRRMSLSIEHCDDLESFVRSKGAMP